ncbi:MULTISPECIES: phage GP46 family protein [Pseudomonas chlororaphis group]|uniref:phage GP46 family protein n=1 Tax=Pseudomonas chlororaphis group TaxID=136842 RepID=UPI0020981B7E|nr:MULTISPECIES: phage GP46 family protein [Pseudomonas chlororaphis group]MCO7576163.1 phage GP46 family protein [Pseudomonas protegens]MCO7580999.1 phage GP46 family protein [Pseudomonas chlororaphis]MCO7597976.1 phage GP46 family protein [Pseudomonas chlororaphis]
MADASMVMTENGGELVLSGFDLARDDGLETAVIISLFTDRRASPEQIPVELPQDDLRGYWGDISNATPSDQTGSLLWLLAREKQLPQVLGRAQQYCREALAWMIEDLVATRVEVTAEFIAQGWMLILVDIYKPTGSPVRYRFNYEWAAQAAKRSA